MRLACFTRLLETLEVTVSDGCTVRGFQRLIWCDLSDLVDEQRRGGRESVGGRPEPVKPRTEGSRRVIALDTGTVAALPEHRRRQNEERLRAGEAWANLDLVFTNAIGDLVNPATFTRWTKQQAAQAGVPPLTPHDAARHGWATLAFTAGVPPRVVQERLGHSSISITMDRYSHVIEGMDRAAAEAVAALIEDSSG